MICTVAGCLEHFACRLRSKGVHVSPRATPSRVANRRQGYRPPPDPAYERGRVGEFRNDGSFMPVLIPGSTEPMGLHERMGQRTRVEEGIRRLKSDPHVFAQKG